MSRQVDCPEHLPKALFGMTLPCGLRMDLSEGEHRGPHVHDSRQHYARWRRTGGRIQIEHADLDRRGDRSVRYVPAGLPDEIDTANRVFPHRVPDRAMRPTVAGGRLRPLRADVLVVPDPETEQTTSGLFLPESALDHRRAQSGTVEAVGPDVLDLRPGDRVIYRKWGGREVWHDGQLKVLLRTRKQTGAGPRQPIIEDPDVFWTEAPA